MHKFKGSIFFIEFSFECEMTLIELKFFLKIFFLSLHYTFKQKFVLIFPIFFFLFKLKENANLAMFWKEIVELQNCYKFFNICIKFTSKN